MHNESAGFDQFHVRRNTNVPLLTLETSRRYASAFVRCRAARRRADVAGHAAAGKTITAVMHSDLRVIDPIMTTAYITRDHGYMVYDTLLATDANFKIQPQMADVRKSPTTS